MVDEETSPDDEPAPEMVVEADAPAESSVEAHTDVAREAEPEIELEPEIETAPELAPEPAFHAEPPEPPAPRIEPPRAQAQIAPLKRVAARTRRGFWPQVRRVALIALLIALFGPPLGVIVFRFLPPPVTELMLQRLVQGYGLDYQWRPLSQISPALTQAAVASEDARFCSHHGFDFGAMEAAMRHNERRPNKIKGGSTISQQTAKNVFLWPGRSYLRKAIEAWDTVLIEALWGKRRIMEVYLNVIEFGPGIYGAQAASQHFFHVDASRLSPEQAARLIAVLPRPLKWQAAEPGAYVSKRTRHIDGAIGTVREDGLAGCVGR